MTTAFTISVKRTDFFLQFQKYWEIIKVNYANSTTYLTNVLARSATVVFRIWIFTQLYKATYAVSGVQSVGGMTVPMVVWTLMFTQGFQIATRPGVIRIIDEEVKSGSLAYSLNRPYSYLLFHYFSQLGRIGPILIANVFIGYFAALLLIGPIFFTLPGILAGMLLLYFGYTLDYIISFILGLTSFWVEDTSAFNWIYQKGQMIFGGNILPLALFPVQLRTIAELLPFSQLFYGSAQTIVNFNFAVFIKFLSVQLIWVGIMTLFAYWLFNKGAKNVSINGG